MAAKCWRPVGCGQGAEDSWQSEWLSPLALVTKSSFGGSRKRPAFLVTPGCREVRGVELATVNFLAVQTVQLETLR